MFGVGCWVLGVGGWVGYWVLALFKVLVLVLGFGFVHAHADTHMHTHTCARTESPTRMVRMAMSRPRITFPRRCWKTNGSSVPSVCQCVVCVCIVRIA